MIRVEQVSVERSGHFLVKQLCTSLAVGELLVVIGPNGAGKSTLLSCMIGDVTPTQGDVYYNDKNISQMSEKVLAKRRAALMQSSELNFAFSVKEVVSLGRYIYEEEELASELIVEKIIDAQGLSHLANNNYMRLSGGEKQRVQLARVLAQLSGASITNRPRYAFFDEPISAMDIRHQVETLRCARSLAREGCGVMCVLHDMNMAAQFADRVLLMHEGRVVADASPEKVLQPSLLEPVFGANVLSIPHPRNGRPIVLPDTPFN